MPHVLIVDDDADSATSLRALVASADVSVAIALNLGDARRQMLLQPPDIVLLDLQLPDGNGLDLFADPELVGNAEIVLITGHASLETSIQALRLGAADYLVKPVNLLQLQGVLSRFMPPAALRAEISGLAAKLEQTGHFGHLWGKAPAMQRVYEQISRVAATGVPIFINGESGTGKELVAQTVHDLSRRRSKPFLAVNCGAISPHLIESEVFGHEKGSFTGAERQHLGYFERATGGTLFLDEITEMPLELQVKLLRVLETNRILRLGASQTVEIDVRVIAASNRPLLRAVAEGKLREDLLYRLNVFPISLPPLRDRLGDVGLLAEHFVSAIGAQEGRQKRIAPAALEQLRLYGWPGNVRELRNAVQRAYVMTEGDVIDGRWLPGGEESPMLPSAEPSTAAKPELLQSFGAGASPAPRIAADSITVPVGTSMAAAERALILATLRYYDHHKERTAAVLGISLKTLYNRLKEYAADNSPAAPPER